MEDDIDLPDNIDSLPDSQRDAIYQRAMDKFIDQSCAKFESQGLRVVIRFQCIRCGGWFDHTQLALIKPHMELCKMVNKG